MASVFKFMQTIPAVTLGTGPSTRKLVKDTWYTETALNTEGRWSMVSTMALAIIFGPYRRQMEMKSPKIRLDTFTLVVGRPAWCTGKGVFSTETVSSSSLCSATTWPNCQTANTSQILSWASSKNKTIWSASNDATLMKLRQKSPNATKQTFIESEVVKIFAWLLMKSE